MTSQQQPITVEARPTPIDIDLSRTAVIVIDMQNDFGSPGGMFDRAGIDISHIQAAVLPTGQVLDAARNAGIRVIYIKMEHRPDLSDVGPADAPHWLKHLPLSVGQTVVNPNEEEGRILVQGTWNTEIVDDLTPQEGDIVVSKHRYSAFFQTDLEVILKTLGIKYLVVTGCTTSVCVESTVRDAMFRDYSCLVMEDCSAEPIGQGLPRSNHEASLLVMETLFGWVSDSGKFLKTLKSQASLASKS